MFSSPSSFLTVIVRCSRDSVKRAFYFPSGLDIWHRSRYDMLHVLDSSLRNLTCSYFASFIYSSLEIVPLVYLYLHFRYVSGLGLLSVSLVLYFYVFFISSFHGRSSLPTYQGTYLPTYLSCTSTCSSLVTSRLKTSLAPSAFPALSGRREI